MDSSGEEDPLESAGLILPIINPISNNPNSSSPLANSKVPAPASPQWPTIGGPLALTEQDLCSKILQTRILTSSFALGRKLLLLLACPPSVPIFPHRSPYIIRSAVGFGVFSALLVSWALTFSIGGEGLFGHVWDKLVMYNLADKYGLTGWM